METNRLKQFCTLVETTNFRKASEILGISHSGLSKSMKILEEEIGGPLFLQSGRGVIVSDFGKNFYTHAKKILTEIHILLDFKNNYNKKKENDLLRLGSFEVFTTYFMGPLLKNYFNEIEIEVYELAPGKLEEAIALNKVDIGITYEPIARKGIEFMKISHLQMQAFCLKGAFKNISLSNIPFVVPSIPLEGQPSGIKGRDAWPEDKLKRNIKYRVELLRTGIEIVRQGLAAIFMPEFIGILYNKSSLPELQIQSIDLPKNVSQIKRDIYIIKRESSPETRHIRQIAKAIREIC